VPVIPSRRAAAFILATNACRRPASQRARIQAMLSAEGSSSAISACRSLIRSPAITGTRESSLRACAGYAAASSGRTTIRGPAAPAPSG
jgi:hypothetical protein